MNEQKRLMIMGAMVLLLIIGNLYVRMSEDGGSALLFSDLANMEEGWSAKLKKNMSDIEALPELSFRMGKEATEPDPQARNPFIYGIDRAKELAQKERMEELAKAREEMMQKAQEAEAEAEQVAQEAAPPQATFSGKIVGVMEDTANQEVVLAVIFNETYFALRPGDRLEDQYRLISASRERVRFEALKTHQEIDITLETH